jgi:hypothetical protein
MPYAFYKIFLLIKKKKGLTRLGLHYKWTELDLAKEQNWNKLIPDKELTQTEVILILDRDKIHPQPNMSWLLPGDATDHRFQQ